MNQKEFPANLEIEQQVLSAMLVRDGEKIPAILNILSADDFYLAEHKIIFNGIVNFYLKGIKFDMLSIAEEMKKTGVLAKVGSDYLLECFGATYTNAYIENHARVVKEKSDLRHLMNVATKIYESAQKEVAPVAEIIGNAQKDFLSLNSGETSRITTYKKYFQQDFKAEIELSKKYSLRKTGFDNIDRHQIFSSGLYLIGATPAAGKTTFAWQMAEQLAKNGETCIYCSYEMSRLELFSKSIARELFKRNPSTTLTAADIRRGAWTNALDSIAVEFKDAKADLRMIELHDETIDDLLTILRPLCTASSNSISVEYSTRKSPVVFIDYLQIIPSSKESAKNGIDDTVRKLKIFQRETNATFIVISSFNRTNYINSVSFESFKESGNIEYTADVVWGLQLNILNHIKSSANISDTRQRIDAAKKEQPRQIQLKCLKNRQGYNYDCYFKYYSAHDFFQPCRMEDFKDDKKSNYYDAD